jgi:hypothetical protein
MEAPADEAAQPVPQVTMKLSIKEAHKVVGLAGPGASFNAVAGTFLRGDAVETTAVPMSIEPGVHKFEFAKEFTFDLNPVRARATWRAQHTRAPVAPVRPPAHHHLFAACADARANARPPVLPRLSPCRPPRSC